MSRLVPEDPRRIGTTRDGFGIFNLRVWVGVHQVTGKPVRPRRRFRASARGREGERQARVAAQAYADELSRDRARLLGADVGGAGAASPPDWEAGTRLAPGTKFGTVMRLMHDERMTPGTMRSWGPATRKNRRDALAKLEAVNTEKVSLMGLRFEEVDTFAVSEMFRFLRERGSAKGKGLVDLSVYSRLINLTFALGAERGLAVSPHYRPELVDRSGSRRPLKRNARHVDWDEVVRALHAVESADPLLARLILLSLYLGTRRSELAGARWIGFHPDIAMLIIDAPLVYGLDDDLKPGVVAKRGSKTGRAQLEKTLPWEAVALLELHRRWCEERAEAQGVGFDPDGFIFSPVADGSRPYNPDALSRKMRELSNELGLADFGLQRLRGLVSSILFKNGVNMTAYKAWMDHTEETAAKHYASSSGEQQRELADGLGATVYGIIHGARREPSDVEAELLSQAEGLLDAVPEAMAAQVRAALARSFAVKERAERNAERMKVADLAKARRRREVEEKRTLTLPEMTAEVAIALQATGSFRIDAGDSVAEWRRAARRAGRVTLRLPVRTIARGTIVVATVLAVDTGVSSTSMPELKERHG